MTVLVTGASGHLGTALVHALLAAGRPVRVLVHSNASALEGLDVEQVRGDVCDAETVRSAVAGCSVVHHLAALVRLHRRDFDAMRSVNVEGVRNVASAAKQHGARLVHYSSIHAYRADRTDAVVDEGREYATDPATPAYDLTKALGSAVADAFVREGLDAVTLHPTGVLGPFDHGTSNQGRWLRRAAMGREPLLVTGGFDWVDVREVAAAAIAAEDASRAPTGEHYIVGGRHAALAEIAAYAASAIGRRPSFVTLPIGIARSVVPLVDLVTGALGMDIPFTSDALSALDTHRNISHAKAASALGLHPRPLEATVRDAMAWYTAQGMVT